MTYRGDDTASAARLAALDEEIRELEEQFVPLFWERVAPVWGLPRGLDEDLDPLAARHARLDALRSTLERARTGPAANAKLSFRNSAGRLWFPRPRFLGRGRRKGEIAVLHLDLGLPLAREIEQVALETDAAARSSDAPRSGRWWCWRSQGVPVDMGVAAVGHGRRQRFELRARTSVAPAARLTVAPEGVLQDLLDWTGIKREIELGSPSFDPVFIIHGEESSAHAYLDAEAQAALMRIGVESSPSVEVWGGNACIAVPVPFSPSESLIPRIVSLLEHWHGKPSPVSLLTS